MGSDAPDLTALHARAEVIHTEAKVIFAAFKQGLKAQKPQ
jgi:hypothetical protein